MNQYDDASRGIFQTEYAKQLISFNGLKFQGRNGLNNVTPTDIDGLVQLDNENCFIFFELKHSGKMPSGQETALVKLCDAVQRGGVDCAVIVAEHNVPYPETIIAKDAIVSEDKGFYMNGKWYKNRKRKTLEEIARGFINFVKKENEHATIESVDAT